MKRRETPGWGYLIFDAAVMCVIMLVVNSLSQVIDTVGDLGAGHGVGEVVLALVAVVGVLAMVLLSVVAILDSRRAKVSRPPTREDELEERRAWLADLREQGAPWHQRLVQRLSLTFVAAPVMAVRRGLRSHTVPWTPRRRVHSFAITVIAVMVTFAIRDGFPDPWSVVGTLAAVLLVDLVACLIIGRRERRKAQQGAA
ncbi:hypothetical protein [Labedaea rhizosphaerae]|uniref:Uncharacterized protein n=1 Tax=Labedaea rhizosphaerae TaxID=598644 RepID=A0A4R6SH33_LABRH|nr:hypothetical protein [Labedaea rhizosphaerae]TDQ00149.1 hypothetical protein EV186_10210 [Labedaea rhizosphaerae]